MNRTIKILAILVVIAVAVVCALGAVLYIKRNDDNDALKSDTDAMSVEVDFDQISPDRQEAVAAGEIISGGKCEGYGSVELGTSPMKLDDFAFIIPYGMMIGSHVTPIDHQYFSPTVFHSPPDTYEIRAMADGRIVDIQRRVREIDGVEDDEFRFVFMHTCTFFTYYDLVTSLEPSIDAEFERVADGNYAGEIDLEVKEGQLVGWIGGRTLDFAVWDTTKPLSGFVIPDHYKSEAWKIYTADPYEYYSDELSETLAAKNLRNVDPIAGKIDHDVDGKLIGNWFLEGSTGYAGSEGLEYWETHLAIVPNHIDPTFYMLSVGDFDGDPAQFGLRRSSPDPTTVDVSSGRIKYELVDFEYYEPGGSAWNRDSLVRGLLAREANQVNGVVLIEMIEDRRVEIEFFPGASLDAVSDFTTAVRTYTR